MPLVINWAGDSIKTSDPESYWSTKGGLFTSASGIKTYFPLPMYYRNAISSKGIYVVPFEYAGRPDLIARELYGSEDYWWLVFWMSGIIDPFSGPSNGDKILIADINQIISVLS